MKESFVFRKEWRDAISGLPDEVRLEIYDAIIEYGITGKYSELKPMARLAFNFAKAALDKDVERNRLISEKRREAGKKHAGNQYTNGTSVPQMEQMEQMFHKWNKESENEKEKESPVVSSPIPPTSIPIEKEKEKERESCAASAASHTHLELLEKRREKFWELVKVFLYNPYTEELINDFFEYWTEPNKSQTKMRFELERTWDTKRRLATWAKNDGRFGKKVAATAAAAGGNPRGETRGTAAAAAEREAQDEERQRRYDEMKRNSVSYADARKSPEYLRALQEN